MVNAKTNRAHEVKGRGAGRSIIEGANIHIFVFCTINFF